MKKIVFLVGNISRKSGIVKVVKNISKELSTLEDYNVSILTIKKSNDIKDYDIQTRIPIHSLEIDEQSRKLVYFLMVSRLKKYLKKNPFDCLVISGMELVLPTLLSLGKKRKEVKLIAWEHRNFTAGLFLRLEWIGKRLACQYFDKIVCITKKDANRYLQYKSTHNIEQIYNLTDFKQKRFDYNIKSKKIMSVGYLSPIKGFDMLVQVASKIFNLPEFNGWSWDIYGDGIEFENLQKKINETHLEGIVNLKGYSNKINELYKEYSFFVMTSRSEGMGMVLIEAQKAGLPIISFDIPCGPSDVIENGKNGFLIEPFKLDDMSNKIKLLMYDKNQRIKLSEYSEYKHNELGREFITQKWIDMVESL